MLRIFTCAVTAEHAVGCIIGSFNVLDIDMQCQGSLPVPAKVGIMPLQSRQLA